MNANSLHHIHSANTFNFDPMQLPQPPPSGRCSSRKLSYGTMEKLWRKFKRSSNVSAHAGGSSSSPGDERQTRAASLGVGALTGEGEQEDYMVRNVGGNSNVNPESNTNNHNNNSNSLSLMSTSMTNDIYHQPSLIPQQFHVTTQTSRGRRQNGMMTVTNSTLVWHAHNTPSIVWPLQYLRRYGYDNGLFTMECGRRCRTGAGVFVFGCADAHLLFHAVQQRIEAINATKNRRLVHDGSSSRLRLSSNGSESGSRRNSRARTPEVVLHNTHEYCTPNAQLMIQLRGQPRRSVTQSDSDHGSRTTHLRADTSVSDRLSSTTSIALSNSSVFDCSSPTSAKPHDSSDHAYVNVVTQPRDTRSASVCVGGNARSPTAPNNDYVNCPLNMMSASTSNVHCDYVQLEVGGGTESTSSRKSSTTTASPPTSAPPLLPTSRRHSMASCSGYPEGCYAVIDTTRTKALQDTHRYANRHRQETMNLKQIASPS